MPLGGLIYLSDMHKGGIARFCAETCECLVKPRNLYRFDLFGMLFAAIGLSLRRRRRFWQVTIV